MMQSASAKLLSELLRKTTLIREAQDTLLRGNLRPVVL